MLINNCEIKVLVKGRPITEFFHNGQFFIEGRGGSNYEIEFRNNNRFRVEVVLSVDGLSVTDGKPAGEQSSGYLVEALSYVKVPGWTLNNEAAAAFAFSASRGGSYVEQTTGSPVNKGVIGALVYKEKHARSEPYYAANSMRGRGIAPRAFGLSSSMTASSVNYSGNGAGVSGMACSAGSSFSDETSAFSAALQQNSAGILRSNIGAINVSQPPVQQTLGTAFGEQTSFHVSKVNFDRGDLLSMMILYYDDIRGLKARGIQMDRVRRQVPNPQAFPGLVTGCKPPEGWRG
jgi:hypothetical protein